MEKEGRAKEIGQTAEEGAQHGFGRIIVLFFIYLVGIPASVIYWVLSIIFWLGCWILAWLGFFVMFVIFWVVNLFRPMPKEWGYRYVSQEDWHLTHEELQQKYGKPPEDLR